MIYSNLEKTLSQNYKNYDIREKEYSLQLQRIINHLHNNVQDTLLELVYIIILPNNPSFDC